ncbi:type IX secretion system membrane protein PorP/SprF [Pedobacter sp. BS3]|uniref:PorP/SprF family type IX secretion system membrane protein n=1 Tax=Pedobacter sp. BS3 TaxID=2567937 RepID=UPI0011ECAB17|nr:type IX secretion system membrane protein PorP/SprF [Pedobacter sp. BS3]TZF82551.1 type IX secretion system membrane protein PorP/SprF [Pedobacter sp. BS3]
MKKYILTFGLLILLLQRNAAQQKPHYSQYVQNMAVLNPAVTGMYKSVSLKAGFRNQWIGLESAPKTSYLTISTPVNFSGDFSGSGSAEYGIETPATRSDKDGYLSSLSHHGIGLVLLNDKTGALTRTTADITYAYHININDVANLAVGVGGGVNRVNVDMASLTFDDPNEPLAAQSAALTRWTPDLNAGFHFYTASFYLGGVVQQVLNRTLSFNADYTTGKEVPHYFIMSGCRFWVKEDFSFSPSVTIKYIRPLPLAYDLNLRLAYRNNFWIGGSYRKHDAYSAMFGFEIAKMVNVGYAYDYTTSALQKVSSGTHEIVLGIDF